MTPRHFVIGTAEHPAYPFWKVPRHAHGEQTAGFEYPFYFFQHAVVVDNVFEYLGADNLIKAIICKRKVEPGCSYKVAMASFFEVEILKALSRGHKIVVAEVQTDNTNISLQACANTMPTLTAAQV